MDGRSMSRRWSSYGLRGRALLCSFIGAMIASNGTGKIHKRRGLTMNIFVQSASVFRRVIDSVAGEHPFLRDQWGSQGQVRFMRGNNQDTFSSTRGGGQDASCMTNASA